MALGPQARIHVPRGAVRGQALEVSRHGIGTEPRGRLQTVGFAQGGRFPVKRIRSQLAQALNAAQRGLHGGRNVLKGQGRQRLGQAAQHLQFVSLNVNLTKRRSAVLGDQAIKRSDRYADAGIPAHPGKGLDALDRVDPLPRQTAHCRSTLAHMQGLGAGDRADRLFNQGDGRMTAVAALQETHARGLRLDSDHPRTQTRPDPQLVANVGADVKTQVAGLDELGVETGQLAAAKGNRVIHEQRAQQAQLPRTQTEAHPDRLVSS